MEETADNSESGQEPKDLVGTENYKFFQNKECEFFPCHEIDDEDEFNCLFCYCPLAFLECEGEYNIIESPKGFFRKDCTPCRLIHRDGDWEYIQKKMEKPVIWLGMKELNDQ